MSEAENINSRLLYQYRSLADQTEKERIKTLLLENKVRLSDPTKFNDPFDRPHITMDGDEEAWRAERKYAIDAIRLTKTGKPLSPAKKVQLAAQYERRQSSSEFIDNFRRNLQNDFSVLCLSISHEKILMWSHYSDSHKGICLGFKFGEIQKSFERQVRIVYQNEYPRVSILDWRDPEKILSAFNTKHTDWAYEEEIRIINMHPSKTVSFDANLIGSVYLGSEISEDDQSFMVELLSNRDLSIELFKAKKDIHNLRLEFEAIEY